MTKNVTSKPVRQAEVVTGLVAIKPRSVVEEFRVGSDGKIERVSPDRCFIHRPFREKVSNIYELFKFLKKYKGCII